MLWPVTQKKHRSVRKPESVISCNSTAKLEIKEEIWNSFARRQLFEARFVKADWAAFW